MLSIHHPALRLYYLCDKEVSFSGSEVCIIAGKNRSRPAEVMQGKACFRSSVAVVRGSCVLPLGLFRVSHLICFSMRVFLQHK